MEGPLQQPPIGREVTATAKVLDRAFGTVLGEQGGTVPSWLVLLALKQEPHRTQQDIARAVGIGGPTLTHHLDAMEAAGLVVRSRDGTDRRAVRVEMTEAGAAMFDRLRAAARAFDARLREGLSEAEVDQARALLRRLRENVSD
jgi:MarR family transcriptional regulator, transcriptional regulator for hemolysin